MKQWCEIPLFRVGFCFFNTETPFLHMGYASTGIHIGYSPKNLFTHFQWADLLPQDNSNSLTQQGNRVFYKWWWDDGTDNRYGYKPRDPQWNAGQTDRPPINTKAAKDIISYTSVPYWLTFWGAGLNFIDWATYDLYIWWYYDDNSKTNLEELPEIDRKKRWVLINGGELQLNLGMQNLIQSGPWVLNPKDVYPDTNINLSFQYQSFWRWGGIHPVPPPNVDPCKVDPTSYPQRGRVPRAVDPRDVEEYTLHPWDLTRQGLITEEKLKQIFGFPPSDIAGLPRPPPQSPQSSEEESDPPTTELRAVRQKRSARTESWLSEDSEKESDSEAGDTLSLLTKQLKRERDFRHRLRKRIRRYLN